MSTGRVVVPDDTPWPMTLTRPVIVVGPTGRWKDGGNTRTLHATSVIDNTVVVVFKDHLLEAIEKTGKNKNA